MTTDFSAFVSIVLDVAIVYYLIYRVLLIIKGTRAVPMLIGLLAIILLYFLSKDAFFGLSTFHWILENFVTNLLLIVVVIFQADIRRALAAFGRTQFLSTFRTGAEAQVVDELVKASISLANQKIGALIVVEREADLGPYMEDCTRLEAKLSKELLYAIFVPERQNPLHDGATVVRGNEVVAAGVFLPMSVNPHLERTLGTRHRAAVGLTEEADALVIVVSEERGSVSLALLGDLELDLDPSRLRERLIELLIQRRSRLFRRERSLMTTLTRQTTPPAVHDSGARSPTPTKEEAPPVT